MPESSPPPAARPFPSSIARRPMPWHAASFRIAAGISILGLAMWLYSAISAATAPAPPASSISSPQGSAFIASSSSAPASTEPATPSSRFIHIAAPATLRFGASFLAGFTLAWLMRQFIRATLLLAALGGAALYGLYRLGVISHDQSDQVSHQLESGLQVARTAADKAKDFLTGYLPSTASGIAGMFLGFRRA